MVKKNKSMVAEPAIPYGRQSWFQPGKYETNYFEVKNIPYSGSSVHYENRPFDRIWKGVSEEHIQDYSFVIIEMKTVGYGKETLVHQRVFRRKKFEHYMFEWKTNRDPLSSILNSLADKNYQMIIQMGKSALPFIFEELKNKNYDDWFDALVKITGDDPVPPEHWGNFVEMSNDWIEWLTSKKLV